MNAVAPVDRSNTLADRGAMPTTTNCVVLWRKRVDFRVRHFEDFCDLAEVEENPTSSAVKVRIFSERSRQFVT